jgi:very-short-patch-repair endonuclease
MMIEDTLQSRAREMRRAMTPAEALLWTMLRTPPLSAWHFRRQVAFPPRYIADFCSHSARVIVEADGEGHVLGHGADAVRNAWFAAQGYRVARFENRQVLGERDGVFEALCTLVAQCAPPPRRAARESLSPQGGGSSGA